MKTRRLVCRALWCFVILSVCFTNSSMSQVLREDKALDAKVKKFLDSHAGRWHDLNVPVTDGQLLFDLIIKGKYTRALEIGTSTGHSGIWIAWALSKTGGKLITIEIDEERHKQAVANFKEAGLADFVDARLADAHDLVRQLKGPFDFVFSDADKDWYKQYFLDVSPKLVVGGCFTAHNVPGPTGGSAGIHEYAKYVTGLKYYETTFNTSGAGMAISYKKSDR